MTFRPMRRIRQQLTEEENEQILRRGSSGVLAVLGDGGWPYTVPMNYVWLNGAVYLHCAFAGHKLDAIRNCDNFTGLGSGWYRVSVRIHEDNEALIHSIRQIMEKGSSWQRTS